mmetsp:Transcript_3494/g.7832  ORF Transcript_3494/g.7832 Transcript_3494/m.7832 type:complete len:152 (+) Transcript_3494:415-870(+)
MKHGPTPRVLPAAGDPASDGGDESGDAGPSCVGRRSPGRAAPGGDASALGGPPSSWAIDAEALLSGGGGTVTFPKVRPGRRSGSGPAASGEVPRSRRATPFGEARAGLLLGCLDYWRGDGDVPRASRARRDFGLRVRHVANSSFGENCAPG